MLRYSHEERALLAQMFSGVGKHLCSGDEQSLTSNSLRALTSSPLRAAPKTCRGQGRVHTRVFTLFPFPAQGTVCDRSPGCHTRVGSGVGVSWLCWQFGLFYPHPTTLEPVCLPPAPTPGDGPLRGNMRLPINHSRMNVLPASSITLISCLLVFKSC